MFIQLGNIADVYAMRTSMSRGGFGLVGSAAHAQMKEALKLYDSDQVVEAMSMISGTDIGGKAEFINDVRMMQAEATTALSSIITRENDWLEIEQIPAEQPMPSLEIASVAEAAIRKVWSTIGSRIGSGILVTILAQDAFLPSHLSTTGYVVAKNKFAKYCLPANTTGDMQTLTWSIQRLAACHAAAIISNSMAPAWLIAAAEGITESPVPDDVRTGFCVGRFKWLEPGPLGAVLDGIKSPQEDSNDALAVFQAMLVGKYLVQEGGMQTFRDLISYFSPTTLVHYMRLLLSADPARDACKRLYEYAPEYLFEQALAACCK